MIPLWLAIRFSSDRRQIRLSLPLFLLWLLLLPLVLILAPVAAIGCLIFFKANPFPICSALWDLFASLRGVHVEVHHPDTTLLISIS